MSSLWSIFMFLNFVYIFTTFGSINNLGAKKATLARLFRMMSKKVSWCKRSLKMGSEGLSLGSFMEEEH